MDGTFQISAAKISFQLFFCFVVILMRGFLAVSIITNYAILFKKKKTFLNEYDFIVIGAGSTGAVVTNRLTEVDDWKVLLLEAGGDETIVSDVPGLAHHLQRTNIDWSYKTVPQSGACLAFNETK
jgi:hypothetical protein